MTKSRFASLDEAVDHINVSKASAVVELKPPPVQEEEESRWWSYTSKQVIVPESGTLQMFASDPQVSDIPGVRYQKCGGGRRIIRKQRRGY